MDEAARASTGTDATRKTDTERLHELGYAQELKRGMSGFSNFAVSFTIISILSGCLTLFGFGMFVGGPASSAYGWLLVGLMVTFVGLAMAEVCSSYPTAGGLYYWSAKLAKKNGPAWAWFTGWFNLLGQVAITAGIDFGLSAFICAFMGIAFDVEVTKVILIGTYTVVLAVHGLLNTFGVRLVAIFNNVSVWWHVAGVAIVVAMCIILPDSHTSLGTIFSFSQGPLGPGQVAGIHQRDRVQKSPISILGITAYVFLIGMLLAQYTITGYDASAHMTEETHDADVAGPNGIWKSIVISVFFGYILLLGGVVRDAGTGGLRRCCRVPVPGDRQHRGAGRDLPRLVRQERRDLRADHRDGRAVLLRHGVRHDELAHDLRVLAVTVRCPVTGGGTRSTSGPAPQPTPSGSPPCWPGCWSRPRTGSVRSSRTSR